MFSENIQTLEGNEVDEQHLREILLPEIQLEIDLRNRLTQTVESRITWATLLQGSLSKGGSLGNDSATFKMAALDALSAIEEPSKLFLDHETIHKASFASLIPTAVPPGRKNRPLPRESRATRSRQNSRFLYIRTDNQTNILTCPECQRTQFSSIQGLYNHARIAHRLEWGNHDDCVRACSVPRNDLDLSDGVEVTLTLLGVRGLFERAVEEPSPLLLLDTMDVDEPVPDPEVTNHIRQTLGVHAETFALASVLGKEVKRREIRARNEDEDVDIDGLANKRLRWHMPRIHTSSAKLEPPREETVHAPTTVHEAKVFVPESVGRLSILGVQPSSSRFHITARVIVMDRSLHLPAGMRPEEATYTHKWMLSVQAPSYSIDITTILSRITVTSLSDCHTFSPLIVAQPPFVVMGVAARPFLARVELLFSHARGQDPEGQKFILEHWVDVSLFFGPSGSLSCTDHIYQLASARSSKLPVEGEQQVVDIELDKETVFLPAKTNYVAVDDKEHWQQEISVDPTDFSIPGNLISMAIVDHPSTSSKNISETAKLPKTAPSAELGYPMVLRELLPNFPVTLEGVIPKRGVAPPTVPYTLVASSDEFHELVLGRRKAIEWGRASAIREAYTEVVKETHRELELDRLSTADVFCWLEAEGLFLRTKSPLAAKQQPQATERLHAERWCTCCGLVSRVHSNNKSGGDSFACNIIPSEWQISRMPLINLHKILATPQTLSLSCPTGTHDERNWSNAQIVQASNPNLLLSIKEVIRVLNLPAFLSNEGSSSIFPIDTVGRDASEVTQAFAPYGVLALVAECFITKLVLGGLDISSRFQHRSPSRRRLLTPMHVAQGLVVGKNRDQTGLAMFYALARIGRQMESEGADVKTSNTFTTRGESLV
ncbi:uncharacterized protein BT62DRAFT_592553 [Guyanagaster necrorhizus]|uniref:YEATS domain-containing protein n=1 Tax=Guyanagaster necrorhizus TaxID=856835 RepID=A0A9P7VZE9_9AGAR|nr:uncharacterized protein BT62DRAFT_592553 [Guyanagaster necrorhizus MCA 3950]KAG7449575.1 hypothetical protein BT62DRAFT_592553 [Guyanagaster necrorhizus MCA 3950]